MQMGRIIGPRLNAKAFAEVRDQALKRVKRLQPERTCVTASCLQPRNKKRKKEKHPCLV